MTTATHTVCGGRKPSSSGLQWEQPSPSYQFDLSHMRFFVSVCFSLTIIPFHEKLKMRSFMHVVSSLCFLGHYKLMAISVTKSGKSLPFYIANITVNFVFLFVCFFRLRVEFWLWLYSLMGSNNSRRSSNMNPDRREEHNASLLDQLVTNTNRDLPSLIGYLIRR